jgi:NAD(P)-dependent dehydrogenase (short-subunit alcohol dehydrogenase family)
MDLELKDKVALVTGGARGIGKATALAFAREGASVGILDILEEETPQTVEELKALGVKAAGLLTDVTQPDVVNDNVKKLAAELGGAHCLVNSAAVLINVNCWPTEHP